MVPVFLQRLITGRLHPHKHTKGSPRVNAKGPTAKEGKTTFWPKNIFILFFSSTHQNES